MARPAHLVTGSAIATEALAAIAHRGLEIGRMLPTEISDYVTQACEDMDVGSYPAWCSAMDFCLVEWKARRQI